MTVRILLVDDHAVLRDGVRMVLQAHPGFEVVGTADDGETAVALVAQLQPDVVVMDIAMPGTNGLQATRAIRTQAPQTQVVVLSMYEGEDVGGELAAALKARRAQLAGQAAVA